MVKWNQSILKRITLGAIALAGLYVGFILIDNNTSLFTRQGDYQLPDSIMQVMEEPKFLYGMMVNDKEVSENKIKRDQNFVDLLEGYFVENKVIQQLNTLPRKLFDFRKVTAGNKYTIVAETDSLKSAKAIIYEASPVNYYVFHLKDTLIIESCEREITKVEKTVAGEITSSLYETIDELGISPELTNKFVDVFGWQVDFQRLQKGDKFKLIYEEKQVEGKPYGIGDILGIYFEHMNNPYFAIPFDQGDGLDYFDEKGMSLRKALLKYPIEFTRISSRYNLNRFHPVAKVFRAHLGTDFAAPTGTPIRSVGDGIVLEAQYKGGNGNYVKVRHNATYTTAYLHMSKIATGMTPGVRVRQGETIGYVGSTGLATGPHVCYRFWKEGVQVDALKIELPPSMPVKKDQLPIFSKVKSDLIQRLNAIHFKENSQKLITPVIPKPI
jgi:murein DD-endopeptidase MepM/ murein hydrolase activator NlpD